MTKIPEIPVIEIKIQQIKATSRKLKVKWTVESSDDAKMYYGFKNRNRRPRDVNESNELFELSFRFNELYPVGSIVHIDEARFLGTVDPSETVKNLLPVKVTSEAVVLIDKSSVGFLCSESKDDGDFYFVDDLSEYAWGKLES